MRILCIGDVVGSAGVTAFGKKMPCPSQNLRKIWTAFFSAQAVET